MKRVSIIAALLSLICMAAPQTFSVRARGAQAAGKRFGSHGCTIRFHYLNRYKSERWSRVFRDREVGPALRRLLKRDYQKLVETLESVSYPDNSLSYVDADGVLKLEGGVPGVRTIMEAILIIEPCGNIYTAILDNGKRILYFSNDRRYLGTLPPAIEGWRASLESARSRTASEPELPVVFKSR
jgi:hypothetical protein